MADPRKMTLAAKCAPEKKILADIENAGIKAVEFYLADNVLDRLPGLLRICRSFNFRYAVHSPRNSFDLKSLVAFCDGIGAEIVIFHNNHWEDEWEQIAKAFKNRKTRPCVENIATVDEPIRYMRRFGMGRCLDVEHLQMECLGVYEEEFIKVMKQASHIHLTGYSYGSQKWHSHIHHNPEHALFMLGLLKKAGYCGLVVSEAEAKYQTAGEFTKLKKFFDRFTKENNK